MIGLVSVACSPDGSESTTTSAEGGPTTTVSSAETTTTEAAPETTTTTEPPSASGGAGCVEGTWILDTSSFIASMQALFTEEGFGADSLTPNEGTYTVTLASDGTFTAERADWGFSVVTADGTFTMSVNGSESGTWTADDATMTVTISSSDVTVSSTAEVDGQVVTLPESPVDVPDAVAEDSAYSCDGDVLTVTTDEVVITLNRA